MIKKLIIENFQSHKYTEIDFSSGVNVIIGLTDNGKSAIIRAIHWLLFNKPSGDSFRRKGSTLTRVYAELASGDILIREKSKSVNRYLLNDLEFRAIGQTPPDEVMKAHGLSRELNFSLQADPFFLLQSSPGQVAQYLNKIVGLEDIDKTIKNINMKRSEALARQNILELLKSNNEDKLALIPDVSDIEVLIADHDVLKAELDSLRNRLNPIVDLWKRYKSRQRFPLSKRLKKCKRLSGNIQALQAIVIQKNKSKNKLRNLQGRLEQNQKLLKDENEILKLQDQIKQLTQVKKWITVAKDKKDSFVKMEEMFQEQQSIINETESAIAKCKKLMPDKCPLCGSLTKNHVGKH